MKILYIHGIGSGANSRTSNLIKQFFSEDEVIAPEIPVMPYEAMSYLYNIVNKEEPDLIIGTSLGGFYAMMLSGPYKILVNPAMIPHEDVFKAVGLGEHQFLKERKDNKKTYVIDDEYINQLQSLHNTFYTMYLDEEVRYETYALFGLNDEHFSHLDLFNDMFSSKHSYVCNSGHRLSEKDIKTHLFKLITEIKEKIDENN